MSTPRLRPMPSFSSISHQPSRKVPRPMGRLMKKTQCQLISWVSTPPASKPREPPPAAVKVNTLIACARSRGLVKPVTINAMITPDERAPPRPWRARATTSVAGSLASPLRADAIVNTTTPARNTFLRPTRSPARPATSRKLPKVIR